MIFDVVECLEKKERIHLHDKAVFLSQVPDATLNCNYESTPESILFHYTEDDINELFRYWFSYYKDLRKKDNYIWK